MICFKDLPSRTTKYFDKVYDKAFDTVKNPNYDGY